MDDIATLQRVIDDAAQMVESVRSDELGKSTPCSEWDVRGLLRHMVEVVSNFGAALGGTKTEPPADNPVPAYRPTAAAMLDAWRQPGALDKTLALPIGNAPGSFGLQIVRADQLLHTWDLARALGRSYTIDPELATMTHEMMQQNLRPEFRGPGKAFAAEVPCPESAPIQDRLLAFSGRHP